MASNIYQNINLGTSSGKTPQPFQSLALISVVGPTDLPINVMDVAIDTTANNVTVTLPLAANGYRWLLWVRGGANQLSITPQASNRVNGGALGNSLVLVNPVGLVMVSQDGNITNQAITLVASAVTFSL